MRNKAFLYASVKLPIGAPDVPRLNLRLNSPYRNPSPVIPQNHAHLRVSLRKVQKGFRTLPVHEGRPRRNLSQRQCRQKTWGKGKVRRLLGTGAGLIFKGSGFYITDYRSEGYKAIRKERCLLPPTALRKRPKPSLMPARKPTAPKAAPKAEPQKTKKKE